MLTLKEITESQKEDKEYKAIGNNGKEYDASYSVKFHTMFFVIPSTVDILGYIEI